MAKHRSDIVLRQLRAALAAKDAERLSDADLLRRFVARRDETAFSLLVRRHSGLVHKVCRHVLHGSADADDAFQATFMVLVRKSASLQNQSSLAGWLHRVAFRCARDAKKIAMRRRKYESSGAGQRAAESPVLSAALNELQAILDEEVQRLPDKYRSPFLLCSLEGKSRTDAAQLLRWNEGTVASRLAKAREILRKRLMARGVSLSAALAAVTVAEPTLSANVPSALIYRTVDAALAFAAGNATTVVSSQVLAIAQGVINGMLFSKLKIGVLVLCATSLTILAAGGLVAQPHGAGKPPEKAAPRRPDIVAGDGPNDPKREPLPSVEPQGNPQAPVNGVEVTAQIAIVKKSLNDDAPKQNAPDDFVRASVAIMSSPVLTKEAISKHKLKDLKSLSESSDPVQKILQSLTIQHDMNTGPNVLNLTYVTPDAKDGVTVLNAIVDSFQEFIERKFDVGGKESFELVKRARQALNDDLRQSFVKYQGFRRALTRLDSDESIKNRVAAFSSKIDDLQIKLIEIDGRLRWIELAKEQGKRIPLLLKAKEWAARSGFDKLKETNDEMIAAYAESSKEEREELQLIMQSLKERLRESQLNRNRYEEEQYMERELLSERKHIHKFLDIVEIQLKQIDLTRTELGYQVLVIRPAALRATRPEGS